MLKMKLVDEMRLSDIYKKFSYFWLIFCSWETPR